MSEIQACLPLGFLTHGLGGVGWMASRRRQGKVFLELGTACAKTPW